MRYEQVIIANRHAVTGDGMGGVTEGALTHVYSGYADVQDIAEQYVSAGAVIAGEGDAMVFLNESDTTALASGIKHGDEITILWSKNTVLVDANGTPLEDDDGEWLWDASDEVQAAAVASLRNLDNHIVVQYE